MPQPIVMVKWFLPFKEVLSTRNCLANGKPTDIQKLRCTYKEPRFPDVFVVKGPKWLMTN